jgi:uncharacterized protein
VSPYTPCIGRALRFFLLASTITGRAERKIRGGQRSYPEAIMRITAFLFLVMATTFAVAQEERAKPIQPDTVYVSGEGKFEADPDTAILNFSISAQESTSEAAYQRGTRAVEQVRQVLRNNGLDPKQAEVGFFNLQPVYDYRSPKRKLLGYRLNTNVSLKLKDFAKVGPIAQAMSELDVTENQSLNYMLDNMDAAKVKAVEDAFRKARAMAEAVARSGQRTLGQLAYASVDTQEEVIPLVMQTKAMRTMSAEATDAAPPTEGFSPSKITVTANVKALFYMK